MTKTRKPLNREDLIRHARKWLREYDIDVNTEAYWNEHVRKPHEARINAYDPDGTLASYAAAIRRMLANEDERPILECATYLPKRKPLTLVKSSKDGAQ